MSRSELFDPDLQCERCGRPFADKLSGGTRRQCSSCALGGVPLKGHDPMLDVRTDEALARLPYLTPAKKDAAWRLLLRRLTKR